MLLVVSKHGDTGEKYMVTITTDNNIVLARTIVTTGKAQAMAKYLTENPNIENVFKFKPTKNILEQVHTMLGDSKQFDIVCNVAAALAPTPIRRRRKKGA